jgi:microcystin degradation protein MlrC
VTIPDDADVRTFILTGCVWTQPAKSVPRATFSELADTFLKAHKGHAPAERLAFTSGT